MLFSHFYDSEMSIIDLFRLYILLSQYRSCDDTQEIWSFVLFIKVSMNMSACTLFNEQNKGSNLLSIITWSVLGQQNVQAKKVYSKIIKDIKWTKWPNSEFYMTGVVMFFLVLFFLVLFLVVVHLSFFSFSLLPSSVHFKIKARLRRLSDVTHSSLVLFCCGRHLGE